VIDAANPISVELGTPFQDSLDLLLQFWGDTLIGIDQKHPGMGRLRNGPVLLGGGIDVLMLYHSGSKLIGNRHCAILAERIYHKDFICPAH
jgi:hypothetical protein